LPEIKALALLLNSLDYLVLALQEIKHNSGSICDMRDRASINHLGDFQQLRDRFLIQLANVSYSGLVWLPGVSAITQIAATGTEPGYFALLIQARTEPQASALLRNSLRLRADAGRPRLV